MTKRNIIVAGIALILLVAIGITIVLGGKASPISVGSLDSHSLKLEQLDLRQASLDLQLLDEAPAHLTAALDHKLDNKLDKLNLKLDNKLDKVSDRLDDLALDSSKADAGALGDGLAAKLLEA